MSYAARCAVAFGAMLALSLLAGYLAESDGLHPIVGIAGCWIAFALGLHWRARR